MKKEQTLEEKVNSKDIIKKEKNSLLTSIADTVKTVFYGGVAVASAYMGWNLMGLDGITNVAAFAGGDLIANNITDKAEGKKTPLVKKVTSMAKQGLAALVMTNVFQYGWQLKENLAPVKRLTSLFGSRGVGGMVSYLKTNWVDYAKRAGMIAGPFLGSVVAVNQAVDHTLKDYSLKGLGKYLKENFVNTYKKIVGPVTGLILTNAALIPSGLNVAVGAGISFVYAIKMAYERIGKKEKKIENYSVPQPA